MSLAGEISQLIFDRSGTSMQEAASEHSSSDQSMLRDADAKFLKADLTGALFAYRSIGRKAEVPLLSALVLAGKLCDAESLVESHIRQSYDPSGVPIALKEVPSELLSGQVCCLYRGLFLCT